VERWRFGRLVLPEPDPPFHAEPRLYMDAALLGDSVLETFELGSTHAHVSEE
jgi:hypothetical protein